MRPPQTDESPDSRDQHGGRSNTHRRALLAAGGAVAVAGCAGFVRNSGTETPDGTLPLQVTNQLTKQVMAEWGGYPDGGVSVGVEIAEIDSETLEETQLFERESKMKQGENPRWENALAVDEAADEYVIKAWGLNEFTMDGDPLNDNIMRFEPGEIAQEIGAKLDVWVGDIFDRDGKLGDIGFLIEPDDKPLA